MTTTTTLPAGSIVVAHDGSTHADRALHWAADQADLENRGLDIVHVAGPAPVPGAPWSSSWSRSPLEVQDLPAHTRLLIEAAVSQVAEHHPTLDARVHVREGDTRQVLLDLARHAHLLVLGSRGRGVVRSLLLGSVSAAVSRHAACPVVVTRPTDADTARAGVVVGADGTVESLPVIEFAFRQASFRSMPLTVVHCYWDAAAAYAGTQAAAAALQADTDELQALLAESVAGLGAKFPDVQVTRRLEHGLVDQVLTHSHEWDLIVVGRPVKPLWRRTFIGSMSTAVLERADCTVAVVSEASEDDGSGER